jgi:hypothetical protein
MRSLMSTKPLRAGGEVDSWCTKCQLLLGHRIVAMNEGKPIKVECLTCRTVHMYRARAPGQKAAPGSTPSKSSSSSPSTARASRAPAPTKAAQAEALRTLSWEKAIAGKAMNEFKAYRVSIGFEEGDLVRHARFGDGVVIRVLDPRKIEVLFKDDTKTLAQNLTD